MWMRASACRNGDKDRARALGGPNGRASVAFAASYRRSVKFFPLSFHAKTVSFTVESEYTSVQYSNYTPVAEEIGIDSVSPIT